MQRFSARFPAIPLSVRAIRGEVRTIAQGCGLDAQTLADVALAVSEAATNAVVHGGNREGAQIAVNVELADGEMLIMVGDEGAGLKPRTDSPGAGLGLPVIATVAKRLDIRSSSKGTEIHMVFPCPAASAV